MEFTEYKTMLGAMPRSTEDSLDSHEWSVITSIYEDMLHDPEFMYYLETQVKPNSPSQETLDDLAYCHAINEYLIWRDEQEDKITNELDVDFSPWL